MSDRIRHLRLSHVVLPLANPVSDAKVLTGRQQPLTETVLLGNVSHRLGNVKIEWDSANLKAANTPDAETSGSSSSSHRAGSAAAITARV